MDIVFDFLELAKSQLASIPSNDANALNASLISPSGTECPLEKRPYQNSFIELINKTNIQKFELITEDGNSSYFRFNSSLNLKNKSFFLANYDSNPCYSSHERNVDFVFDYSIDKERYQNFTELRWSSSNDFDVNVPSQTLTLDYYYLYAPINDILDSEQSQQSKMRRLRSLPLKGKHVQVVFNYTMSSDGIFIDSLILSEENVAKEYISRGTPGQLVHSAKYRSESEKKILKFMIFKE